VTLALIMLNVLVFGVQIALAKDAHAALGMGPYMRAMLQAGANYVPFVVGEHRYELLLTSCFLHFSLIHIGFNMYALRQVGPFVEINVGTARFASMYLASGIAGSAASALWGGLLSQERLSAGASGAICGVIGTALVLGARMQGWRGPIVRSMGFWLALTIFLGFGIGADNAAHIGGAATGAIFAGLWRRGIVYSTARQQMTLATCVVVVVVAFGVLAVRDLTDPYATLDVDAREARARAALDLGRCADAIRATEAAARIAPRAPFVENLKGDIALRCRR
jgi:rhomboid protease GluP